MDLNTQGSEDNMAVVVRNAVKSFGKNEPRVLDELNMSVPRGCIYGLLGASGAGKTTLLSVLISLLKLDSGEVKVLGVTPGDKGSGVPGARIGYMPQEIALVDTFNVENTFFYFGWIYGMSKSDITRRLNFLSDLLDLPQSSRLVKNLSGGQMRRLSLAMAVMHNPELLILDEPTVGQDPILRHSIWNYMVELSEKQNLTIIITTHYIEETRGAHKIGLLRNGKMLIESSPNHLLIKFNCTTLEEVSLLLSQKQSDSIHNTANANADQFQIAGSSGAPDKNIVNTEETVDIIEFVSKPLPKDDGAAKLNSTSLSRIRAVLYKNWLKFIRNIPGLCFTFLLPVMCIVCFVNSIGGNVSLIPIGIVNEELGNCLELPGRIETHSSVQLIEEDVCQFTGMSCLYMNKIDTNKVLIYYFDTIEKALEATKKSYTFSTIQFKNNFTAALQTRLQTPLENDNDTLNRSEIKIWMDMTDFVIGHSLKKYYLDKFKELQEYVSDQCNYTKAFISLPIRFNDPLYGTNEENHTLTMAPGYILAIFIYMTTSYSATAILTDKLEGVWRRNIAAGLTSMEILASHLFSQICVMLVIMVEIILLAFYMIGIYLEGNVWALLSIVLIQGLFGVALGIFISTVSVNLVAAFMISSGVMVTYFILCGTLWPTEGMQYVLQYISYFLPGYTATNSFHSVLYRGWGITHSAVYSGFLITLFWTFLLIALSFLRLRYSSH